MSISKADRTKRSLWSFSKALLSESESKREKAQGLNSNRPRPPQRHCTEMKPSNEYQSSSFRARHIRCTAKRCPGAFHAGTFQQNNRPEKKIKSCWLPHVKSSHKAVIETPVFKSRSHSSEFPQAPHLHPLLQGQQHPTSRTLHPLDTRPLEAESTQVRGKAYLLQCDISYSGQLELCTKPTSRHQVFWGTLPWNMAFVDGSIHKSV